jgi:hypothetical protein
VLARFTCRLSFSARFKLRLSARFRVRFRRRVALYRWL